MSTSKVWNGLLSELFVNLSAGWFGAALVVPTFSDKITTINFVVLIGDVFVGIVFLLTGYLLRKKIIL